MRAATTLSNCTSQDLRVSSIVGIGLTADARRVPRHQKEADAVLHRAAVAGARGDDQDVGKMRVADKELGAGERKAAGRFARREGDARGIPAQSRLGPGERRLFLAGGDPRQPFRLLGRDCPLP